MKNYRMIVKAAVLTGYGLLAGLLLCLWFFPAHAFSWTNWRVEPVKSGTFAWSPQSGFLRSFLGSPSYLATGVASPPAWQITSDNQVIGVIGTLNLFGAGNMEPNQTQNNFNSSFQVGAELLGIQAAIGCDFEHAGFCSRESQVWSLTFNPAQVINTLAPK